MVQEYMNNGSKVHEQWFRSTWTSRFACILHRVGFPRDIWSCMEAGQVLSNDHLREGVVNGQRTACTTSCVDGWIIHRYSVCEELHLSVYLFP